MILDRDAILVASEILTSDDFYQKQYGIIFDAMVELCNEGKPVDLVTLQNRLKEKELPPDISSMEYVRDLISAVPTSANVKYYAKIVSEKAVLRRLIKANEEIANTCYLEKENTEIILEEAEKKLFNILPGQIEHVDPFGKEIIIDSVLSFQQRFFQPPEHGVEILRIEILIVRVEYLMVKAA